MIFSKKAVSEMVSYVLLVIIAVGVSVAVYNFLSVYTPKDHAACSTDVRVVLQSASCINGNPGNLTLTFSNKGLFKIDAVYVRFGEQNRKVKDLINKNENEGGGLYFTTFVGSSNPGLQPQTSAIKSFALNLDPAKKYSVEIEPAVFSESNELALCPQATITQDITCS